MQTGAMKRAKLVAHLRDGEIFKGYSRDFDGVSPSFHVYTADESVGRSRRIDLDELKALFYVRSWGRGPGRVDRTYAFGAQVMEPGRRAAVRFRDGEQIWGYVLDDEVSDSGFFLIPANPEDNNIKIFVVRSSVEDMAFLPDEEGTEH